MTARSADHHIRPRPATDGALALGLMHVIFTENLHDEAYLEAHTHGWRELRQRALEYPPERVSEITGVPSEEIISLARLYATTKPALLKTADGVQRHGNGGQTMRALCCLPAITGNVGVLGGGFFYSTSGYGKWNYEAVGHASECAPTPRVINMNRLGAALTGEAQDPPVKSLYVFAANPVASSPNAGRIAEGLLRDDLFTVVHEQFLTDTARYADIVLPATTQLEHVDVHKAYGHRHIQFNMPSIAPLGEAKSNWDVMRLLADGMGYDEPWLRESGEEVIRGVLDATRPNNPYLAEITFERLQAEGTVPLSFALGKEIPFADGMFPTPSGKLELLSERMLTEGIDCLPQYQPPPEFGKHNTAPGRHAKLTLLSGASHHYVSSSLANQPSLMAKEGEPFVELHPEDAAERGVVNGTYVIVENERGWCELRVVVTDDVPRGVAVAPKGPWARLSRAGRNINWTTPDALGDIAGQSTFHSNLVEIRPTG